MTTERARILFSERILPHLDDAYGLARWLTGNSFDAEDVTQEACLRALKSIERAHTTNPRAWLLAIIRNCAFTWLARNRPHNVVLTDDVEASSFPDLTDDAPTVEAAIIAQADAAFLERAIDRLPTVFREVLVMREFSGLSYRDIAETTTVPVGTVMSRLARARAMLLKSLKEDLT